MREVEKVDKRVDVSLGQDVDAQALLVDRSARRRAVIVPSLGLPALWCGSERT